MMTDADGYLRWHCNIGECISEVAAENEEELIEGVVHYLKEHHGRRHVCVCKWPLVMTESSSKELLAETVHIGSCPFFPLGFDNISIGDNEDPPMFSHHNAIRRAMGLPEYKMNLKFEVKTDPNWPTGPGSWCIYGYNGPPVAMRIYDSIIDAVKSMSGGEQICWWPDGVDLLDAIEQWNKPIVKE